MDTRRSAPRPAMVQEIVNILLATRGITRIGALRTAHHIYMQQHEL